MSEQQRPSSPEVNPVDVKECIEELINFIFQSYMNGTTPEFDNININKQLCSNLLRINHHPLPFSLTQDTLGEPVKPLYKFLASALYDSIAPGNKGDNKTPLFDNSSCDFKQLVLDKGSHLLHILSTVNFQLHVQEPFFSQLKDGSKLVEGRCATGDYKRIRSGSLILFNKCLVFEVQEVHKYASFSEMLETESLAKVLPGIKTIEEGVQVYRQFYSEEKERSNGVVAICVAKSAAQPYVFVADMLSGLGSEGLQSLIERYTRS